MYLLLLLSNSLTKGMYDLRFIFKIKRIHLHWRRTEARRKLSPLKSNLRRCLLGDLHGYQI
jgi:hypothetical protein